MNKRIKLLSALLFTLLFSFEAHAASRTAWTAGNGPGLTWTSVFASTDMTSLASGSSVLSTATAIANGSNFDTYADISVGITVSSSTPSAGGFIAVYALPLNQDGTTYGDAGLVAGTQKVYVPPYAPICTIPLVAAATTLMTGQCIGVLLPPDTISFAVYNFSNVAFSATGGNNLVKIKTYNINLNN
jgi:hypothetical protein